MKTLFQKFSGYGEVKKDYLAIDFFKIVQEYSMLDLFNSKEEVQTLIDYVGKKFIAEIELERQWLLQNQNKENIN